MMKVIVTSSMRVVMTNISQLEQTSEEHESQIALVMICFWGISLFASLFLARLSVKPLLESMQKQKAFVENASHELWTPLVVLRKIASKRFLESLKRPLWNRVRILHPVWMKFEI